VSGSAARPEGWRRGFGQKAAKVLGLKCSVNGTACSTSPEYNGF